MADKPGHREVTLPIMSVCSLRWDLGWPETRLTTWPFRRLQPPAFGSPQTTGYITGLGRDWWFEHRVCCKQLVALVILTISIVGASSGANSWLLKRTIWILDALSGANSWWLVWTGRSSTWWLGWPSRSPWTQTSGIYEHKKQITKKKLFRFYCFNHEPILCSLLNYYMYIYLSASTLLVSFPVS